MASAGAQAAAAAGGGAGAQGVAAPAAPQKNELSPVLQQLSLESIRTRTQDLFLAISRIIQSFKTLPQHRWSEVLGQFSMVNVELLNLVEDVKPILKMFVVHPKNVNAENAPRLPIMLSSKLLPEMETEEVSLKEQILAGLSGLPMQMEKLQRQIQMVQAACELAEKVLSDNRKLYGLGSRQAPAIIPPLDKAQVAKIAEQERLLRAAANYGEGLRLPPNERQQPTALPPHLSQALSNVDGGSSIYQGVGFSKGISSTISSMVGTLSGTLQQATTAHLLGRSTPSPLPMLGGTSSLEGTSASPMPYASSPRSGNTVMNEASPQQQQQQQQQTLLQRQKVQQLQKQQQMQQQQQQLRQPATPPIAQSQLQQLQQQQQAQLVQHIQAQQDRHQLQQMQLQQQTLQLQLQNNPLQPGQQLQQSMGQNQLAQANQVKPHLGQLASNPTNSLFGGTQSSMLSSNMMANLSQNVQAQPLLQQRLHYGVGMSAGGQSQRNLSSQMLADPMYNMGIGGSQNSANVGLPLQQQLVGQSNFNSILNSNQNLNFGQQRQQPPP